mmetsp:Transcript_20932/g.23285  ORF Transcript_20932/g.23285 Transcript_20932/m.23285 type:complete len:302 (+) Transcript_20932:796-1701(+)|eukprot:CAMPEP_0205827054 /NCGR_PEP_ID=MMETSP0206-20130828/30648_1 /ASSEMBLY_ACC=CAM_ASM_000279 /TAXON_ID=36767 /ORGANISM="Euplotes focardii, Strain TN1" /LENGTH=301 /DNA_ID=CAMNT_0053127549 /DNA_START=796 /DNA_END=1701 /DNA_ORIENTATION=+
MKTRKRIREKQEKTKPHKPVIIDPEDFIDEDYEIVKRLMKQALQKSKTEQSRKASLEDKLSTESDQENKSHSTPKRRKADKTSSNSEVSNSHNSEESQSDKSESQKSSEENKSRKSQSSNHETSNAKKDVKIVKKSISIRKRDLKNDEKINKGLAGFLNLVMHLKDFKKDSNQSGEISQEDQKEEIKNESEEGLKHIENLEEKAQTEGERSSNQDDTVDRQQKSVELIQPADLPEQNYKVNMSGGTLKSDLQRGERVDVEDSQLSKANLQQPVIQIGLQSGQNPQLGCIKTSTEYPLTNNQ